MYVGKENASTRVNNGKKNYQNFVAGEFQDVDEEMAAILRPFDYFVVREKSEEAPIKRLQLRWQNHENH